MILRRQQFTIGSLMVVIAVVAACLAYPGIAIFLMIHLAIIVAIPFAFLVFLAAPLILLQWLESSDAWFERRRELRRSPADLGGIITKPYPIESRS